MPRKRTALTLTALALVAAAPACADDRLARADELITAAVAEHTVFQTCMSLLPEDQSLVAGTWTRMAERGIDVLADVAGAEPLVAHLQATLAPEALVPPADTPFGEVRALCATDPLWLHRLQRFDFIQLDRDLEALFE